MCPTMYGFYEDGIFHKPPLHKLDSKAWAKKMHKAGKLVQIGEYSISKGKWVFSDYNPPEAKGGKQRKYDDTFVYLVLECLCNMEDGTRRTVKEVADLILEPIT